MPKIHFSIWKIALFGGLLAFSALLWLNSHVGYQAKSALLVNAYNGNQEDVVAKTIAAFAHTETYVSRTLGSTRLQESDLSLLSPEAQKEMIESVAVNGGKKGGLVTVVAKDADSDKAVVASTESAETLLRMSRVYLGDEKELTLTVIDEAIVTKALISPVLYVVEVLATTVLLFAVILLLQPSGRFISTRLKNTWSKLRGEAQTETVEKETEVLDQRFVPQKLDPTFLYPEEGVKEILPQPKAKDVLNQEVFGEAPKSPLQSVSVSMEDLPFTFESTEESSVPQEQIFPEEKEAVGETQKEPTVLEYKQRLNELLAQK